MAELALNHHVPKWIPRDPSPKTCSMENVLWSGKFGELKFGLGVQNEGGQRLIEFCQENALVITNTLFQQQRRRLYTWTSPNGRYQIRLIIFFAAKDGEAVYSQQQQDW